LIRTSWIAAAALLLAATGARADTFLIGGLVNAGLPLPLGIELFARNDLLGVGVGYSALTEGMGDALLSAADVKNAKLSANAIDLDIRIFPFSGSFFLGASAGRQSISASATQNGQSASAEVTTLMIAPRLGWLWSIGVFNIGFDLGVQLPFAASKTINAPQGANTSDVNSAADVVGSTPLPSVHLRLGFLI
jgi:hypothetical protein